METTSKCCISSHILIKKILLFGSELLYINYITKSSILIGFSIINHPFWGTPIYGNLHITHNTHPLPGNTETMVSSHAACMVFSDSSSKVFVATTATYNTTLAAEDKPQLFGFSLAKFLYIYIIDPSPDYLLLSSIIVTPKKIYWFILLGITVKSLLYIYTPSWLFNIAMEAMAHRNRWFMMIYLLTMVISHSCVNYQSFSHWNDIISGNEHDTYLWGNHMSLLKMVISHIR